MLLQAYDYLELHRRDGVTLQIGGSDQWGNITAGMELIRRSAGGDAHALTLPLVTTAAGTKFGKTEAGAVWLDPARTSPYQFYQFWINADDRDVGRYLRFFTLLPREEVERLDAVTVEHPERREAQQALAMDVTARVHGADAARVAQEMSALLFAKGDPHQLSADAVAALAEEVPFLAYGRSADGAEPDVLDLLVEAKLAASKGAAKRLLEQGGVTVSGRRLTAAERQITADDYLPGRHLLLRKGARDYAMVHVTG
jgi:tyrosyl-tRNA synthetase